VREDQYVRPALLWAMSVLLKQKTDDLTEMTAWNVILSTYRGAGLNLSRQERERMKEIEEHVEKLARRVVLRGEAG
jgi:hypothetical protein